jgi:hypothetical protein
VLTSFGSDVILVEARLEVFVNEALYFERSSCIPKG